jgi:hypothetical protein
MEALLLKEGEGPWGMGGPSRGGKNCAYLYMIMNKWIMRYQNLSDFFVGNLLFAL